mmetsp:Transcript_9160/g.30546  ORF Transcript_9160/g.30546 Transcript_9160/m.30546 type:complete len:140 (+) Transcript_9160:120-539(+)
MAPLLEMALDSERRTNLLPHLRRIWLVWTVQSYDQLMWFEALLLRCFSASMVTSGSSGFSMKVQLFVTRDNRQGRSMASSSMPFKKERPDMDRIFNTIARDTRGTDVATLVCGPVSLVSSASSRSRLHGFDCHVETFNL